MRHHVWFWKLFLTFPVALWDSIVCIGYYESFPLQWTTFLPLAQFSFFIWHSRSFTLSPLCKISKRCLQSGIFNTHVLPRLECDDADSRAMQLWWKMSHLRQTRAPLRDESWALSVFGISDNTLIRRLWAYSNQANKRLWSDVCSVW